MSVYSGFSTRAQETHYAKLTEKLIDLLQSKLLFFIRSYSLNDDSWSRQFYSIHKEMVKLELQKYLAPRFSESCKGLASYVSRSIHRAYDAIEMRDHSIDNYLARLSNTQKYYKMSPGIEDSPKYTGKTTKKARYLSRSPPSNKHRNGMIHKNYYVQLMDVFLKENSRFVKKSHFPKRRKYAPPSYHASPEKQEEHDFWLIDDKIHLFET